MTSPRFDISISVGNPWQIAGDDDAKWIIAVDGIKPRNSLVLWLDGQRVGSIDRFTIRGSVAYLGGRANCATKKRDEFVACARGGFPWQASLRTLPTHIERHVARDPVEINGTSVDGPLNVIRSSDLLGVTICGHEGPEASEVRVHA